MVARIVNVDMTISDLKRRLRAKGWKRAGSGFYGFAEVKGTLAWKVQAIGGLKGWGTYIQAVARGELRGPHVPRVKLVLVLKPDRPGDDVPVAALMERLQGTIYEIWGDDFGDGADAQRSRAVKSVLERRVHGLQAWGSPEIKSPVDAARRVKEVGIPKSLLAFSREFDRWMHPNYDPAVATVVRKYMGYDFVPKGRSREGVGGTDIHGGNIMLRKDGTVVVTDPIT
jgi:hypothetical protein